MGAVPWAAAEAAAVAAAAAAAAAAEEDKASASDFAAAVDYQDWSTDWWVYEYTQEMTEK